MSERRAPVQGYEGPERRRGERKPPGSIAWWEHEEAWQGYSKRYNNGQDAERIAERSGFSYEELVVFLGREPATWKPRAVG